MKRVLGVIVTLLLCVASQSYGMSGDQLGHAQVFDPLWFWSRGFSPFKRQRLSHDSSGLPITLPLLRTLHKQPEAGQSRLEQLPQEVLNQIIQNIPQEKRNIALTSESLRGYTQGLITRLIIPVEDITENNLRKAKEKFPKVVSLTIKGRGITPQQINILAREFPKVISLDLSDTDLTVIETIALSQPGIFVNLTALNISGNSKLANSAIAILTQAPFVKQLKELDLRKTSISLEGIKVLAEADRFSALSSLKLSGSGFTKIGNEGINVLTLAPFAGNLEVLYLEDEGITPEGIDRLVLSGAFKSLKSLSLAGNNEPRARGTNHYTVVTFDEEFDAMRENREFLQYGDKVIKALTQGSLAEQLEFLDLQNIGKISKIGLEALSQPGKFIALKSLNLSANSIDDKDILALRKAPFAGKLESLHLGLSVSLATKQMLRDLDIAKHIS